MLLFILSPEHQWIICYYFKKDNRDRYHTVQFIMILSGREKSIHGILFQKLSNLRKSQIPKGKKCRKI